MLITTAQRAERAAGVARTIVTAEELAATLPLLQPVAFSRATRAALKKDRGLLEALSDRLQGDTDRGPAEPIRVERFRPRTVVSIVALIVAGYPRRSFVERADEGRAGEPSQAVRSEEGAVASVAAADDAAERWQANRAVGVSAVGLAVTGVLELLIAVLTDSVGHSVTPFTTPPSPA